MKSIFIVIALFLSNIVLGQSIKWEHFKHKYGFSIDLPNSFSVGSLTNSGIQYYPNSIDDGISLDVETNGIGNLKLLQDDYKALLKVHDKPSLKVIKDNWFVISGENENNIYYIKEYFKDNQTYTLSISYPKKHSDYFNQVLGKISKSFK